MVVYESPFTSHIQAILLTCKSLECAIDGTLCLSYNNVSLMLAIQSEIFE